MAVLHAGLYEDITTRAQADSRPWRPNPPGSAASPYAVTGPRDDLACFSVVELDAGGALLWASTCITGWVIWGWPPGPRINSRFPGNCRRDVCLAGAGAERAG